MQSLLYSKQQHQVTGREGLSSYTRGPQISRDLNDTCRRKPDKKFGLIPSTQPELLSAQPELLELAWKFEPSQLFQLWIRHVTCPCARALLPGAQDYLSGSVLCWRGHCQLGDQLAYGWVLLAPGYGFWVLPVLGHTLITALDFRALEWQKHTHLAHTKFMEMLDFGSRFIFHTKMTALQSFYIASEQVS